MNDPGKQSANPCEAIFDEFVVWYGGELTDSLFAPNRDRPSNADYLFEGRTVVAELKCLRKEFFNDPIVGEKANKLIQGWLRKGKIPKNHMNGSKVTIPESLAPKIVDILKPPLKSALEKANQQIKRTKNTHGAQGAKGLLILVNEQNSALTPDVAFYILANLLKNRYSQIASFIYTVPTMPMHNETLGKAANLWVSGNARDGVDGVEPAILSSIKRGWVRFLEQKFDYEIEILEPADVGILNELSFILS
ncbi:hypothetical protein [Sedimenticola selenatireducens]|uniref:hypothetical protein n=1 Tax=Sedimenticola selenatireducens TaxID=191960 RepID=UPI002AAB3929|nr:hypothetical protein [Sedimenticola selenatireducens]